jgi:phosphatidylserine/phosphatidylglycerophosphate/cardiolipin synthase-like enzyme
VNSRSGLTAWSVSDLERLAARVRDGLIKAPLSDDDLAAARVGGRVADIPWVTQLDGAGLLAVLEVALAERAAASAPRIELVWTGPDVAGATSRDTAVVVRQLFESAEKDVLVAGYSFDHGDEILAPLHDRMKAHGVRVQLFLDLPRAEGASIAVGHHVDLEVSRFLRQRWKLGAPYPRIYYAPHTVSAGSLASLHAKCVVVDERVALVTSANFTQRGQDRNVEVGALVEDPAFAKSLVHQWNQARSAGVFVEAPVSGG